MKKNLPTFSYEESLWKKGYTVIGVDEVGRGPLAGPVYVAAATFPTHMEAVKRKEITYLGLNDSKKLTEKQRMAFVPHIHRYAAAVSVVSSSVETINRNGITGTIRSAVCTAVQNVISDLSISSRQAFLLVDGLPIRGTEELELGGQTAIIKGDAKSISIAAASILAKVERDTYMEDLGKDFPAYGWEKNKGYGTTAHRTAIQTQGLTPHHRTKFVEKIITAS